MSRRHAHNDPGHAHFLTFSCYRNQQLLTDDRTNTLLAQAIEAARDAEQFRLWAYVFMPNHVHLLICPTTDDYSVPSILRRIKEPVTRSIVRTWQEEAPKKLARLRARQGRRTVHRFWQAGGGYDRNLTNWHDIGRAVEYIEYNPVRRGLVADPAEWKWSSARARAELPGVALSVDSLKLDDPVHRGSLDKP
jgi:putative transposase